MPVSRRLRFEVLRRDGHTCRYCGAKAPDVALTVDHVIPTTLGGGDEPDNLVAACQPCNAGKTSIAPGSALVDDVEADAIRWASALKMAAWYRKIDREVMDEQVAEFDAAWSCWRLGNTDELVPREGGWEDSVERFLSLGLTQEEMTKLIRVSMNKVRGDDAWRYFCGCCWRAVSDLQELARRHLEANANG
jgi:hypothetical protein